VSQVLEFEDGELGFYSLLIYDMCWELTLWIRRDRRGKGVVLACVLFALMNVLVCFFWEGVSRNIEESIIVLFSALGNASLSFIQ